MLLCVKKGSDQCLAEVIIDARTIVYLTIIVYSLMMVVNSFYLGYFIWTICE
jgi:hypothetical protein